MKSLPHRPPLLFALLVCTQMAAGCSKPSSETAAPQIGNASRGAALISWYGCGACHSIPGVPGANALVGPPLDHFVHRSYVAGMLRNTPDNVVRWIRDPQNVVPGNAMPALGIDNRDAHDITAYLYTLE
jgi:cytochrome c2